MLEARLLMGVMSSLCIMIDSRFFFSALYVHSTLGYFVTLWLKSFKRHPCQRPFIRSFFPSRTIEANFTNLRLHEYRNSVARREQRLGCIAPILSFIISALGVGAVIRLLCQLSVDYILTEQCLPSFQDVVLSHQSKVGPTIPTQ